MYISIIGGVQKYKNMEINVENKLMYIKKYGCNIGGRKLCLDIFRFWIFGDMLKIIDRV